MPQSFAFAKTEVFRLLRLLLLTFELILPLQRLSLLFLVELLQNGHIKTISKAMKNEHGHARLMTPPVSTIARGWANNLCQPSGLSNKVQLPST